MQHFLSKFGKVFAVNQLTRLFTMKCLVVGGGPSGLVAARHLREVMDVTVSECKSEIGGLWNFTELTDDTTPSHDLFKSIYGHQHGSIYEGMLLNIPLEISHTEDFSKDMHDTSFPERTALQDYLLKYTSHFSLRPLVRLNTCVTHIDTLPDHTFSVTFKTASGNTESHHFHRVVIANGHYSVPYLPHFAGIEGFAGKVWHSHNFRRIPEDKYRGKRLMMVGGGSSSWDMVKFCVNECPHMTQMCISTKEKRELFFRSITDPLFSQLLATGRLKIVPEISKFDGNTAYYSSGGKDSVDEVVMCTGYRFSFPFMPSLRLTPDGDFVHDFYKGVFSLDNPNLALIGVHRGVLCLKLELVAKWLSREFVGKPDIDRWRRSYDEEKQTCERLNKPFVSLFTQVDSPQQTMDYFKTEGIQYDQIYADKCQSLFEKTWTLRKSHFFSYKSMKL